ncbi:hypothetical protein GWK47_036143 [Chionoecetes opilio]|uniref:Uncharacterized protein n=1 Tax=Chionoecetes opilio TaxID=41210 RepID=A0A8J4YTC9_CHIOP|nr:hypothetical protein GWK47_036143 [Chionoecetes opilio]
MALFNYGGGGGPHGASGKAPPPCLAGGCGGGGGILANHTGGAARHNHAPLANTIYKVTPTTDDDKFLTPNSGAPPPTVSPPMASPAKEATYGTLRKETPTLKPVPPPTLPPAAITTPSHTPMLATRVKKTVTICDTVGVDGRAASPISPGRI